MAYHGIQNEYVEAEQAFEWVYRFLEGEGSGETVIVSVKQVSRRVSAAAMRIADPVFAGELDAGLRSGDVEAAQ